MCCRDITCSEFDVWIYAVVRVMMHRHKQTDATSDQATDADLWLSSTPDLVKKRASTAITRLHNWTYLAWDLSCHTSSWR